jgi:asparagine synthase (glutamine-hydrolysing)
MCGILALIGNTNTKFDEDLRKKYLQLSKLMRHRGPDWNGIYCDETNKVLIAHERLAIVGLDNGSQPIVDKESNYILSVNGEIYNYKDIKKMVVQNTYEFQTSSDCEVIIPLINELGTNGIKLLDGIFSFIYYDKINNNFIVARDPIGVTPLYYGETEQGEMVFSSELKCIQKESSNIKIFPPGHYMTSDRKLVRYYNPRWNQPYLLEKQKLLRDSSITQGVCHLASPVLDPKVKKDMEEELSVKIRDTLEAAVSKRLMTEVPFGVLLSGGLDSSLIASITSRLLKQKDTHWGNKLHSFSIGLPNSPDLLAAKKVSNFLGTIHHEYTFTPQEGLDALEDLIWILETYDVTTIRASTPMYLMTRKIKSTGIKMVLSGEGADEILGGYLYFHNAPNDEEFQSECVSKINKLHYFDCLRANKSTMAWGVEARVPFLDKEVLELLTPIHPQLKLSETTNLRQTGKIEKYILRKAYDTPDPYLPDEVLWRQKEQFSDGVGYGWIDHLIEYSTSKITDEEMVNLADKYPINTPRNKEALLYRKIFDKLFPGKAEIVPSWIPKTSWDGVHADPSGRSQNVHVSKTTFE